MSSKDRLCVQCDKKLGASYKMSATGEATCLFCVNAENQEKLSRFTADLEKGLQKEMSQNPVVLAQRQVQLLEAILERLKQPVTRHDIKPKKPYTSN